MTAEAAPQLVEQLRDALDRLATADPTELAEAARFGVLCGLFEVEPVLRLAQSRWLAAADTADTIVAEAGRAPRSWLVEECQLAPADAGKRLRLARNLAAFPDLEKALRAAQVTAEQADVIITALRDVPAEHRAAVEAELLAHADELSPYQLGMRVEQILAQLGTDTAADRAEAARQRRLGRRGVDLDATFAGTGSLTGTLTPDSYEAVRAALDAIDPPTPFGSEDDRTPRQRRHDALTSLARYYLDHADALPTCNGERPRVVITIPAADLLTTSPDTLDDSRWARTDTGLPVPPDTMRRLACDAQLLPLTLDSDGQPLSVGRTTRTWPTPLRRAAWLRDRGRCTFPGCRRPPADLHHIVWWTNGGETSLANAALLCAFHHWLVHESGWSLTRERDTQELVFASPHGREFRHPPRQPGAA